MKKGFEMPIAETKREQTFFEQPVTRINRQALERVEQSETERETRRIKEKLEQENKPESPALPWSGDFEDASVSPEKQIRLTPAEYKKLNKKTDAFFEEVKDSKTATNVGYDVPAAYDAHVKGWTTRAKIIDIDGKKAFALCNYPASRWRRLSDRMMEYISGDPMHKPKPSTWKETVEARSNIPTIAGTPENMVLMPYIESINAYDVFAEQKNIKDFGPFEWAKTLTLEDKIAMAGDFAKTLKATHDTGRTWGEAILPNLILTKDKTPILIDAETTYEGIPTNEQKALDIRNLISSISGALARSAEVKDFRPIVKNVLDQYPDPEIRTELKRVCSQPQPWRQRLVFNTFSKFRLGATDLDEFERVKKAIVAVLDQA
jgi:hypothetical protein